MVSRWVLMIEAILFFANIITQPDTWYLENLPGFFTSTTCTFPSSRLCLILSYGFDNWSVTVYRKTPLDLLEMTLKSTYLIGKWYIFSSRILPYQFLVLFPWLVIHSGSFWRLELIHAQMLISAYTWFLWFS